MWAPLSPAGTSGFFPYVIFLFPTFPPPPPRSRTRLNKYNGTSSVRRTSGGRAIRTVPPPPPPGGGASPHHRSRTTTSRTTSDRPRHPSRGPWSASGVGIAASSRRIDRRRKSRICTFVGRKRSSKWERTMPRRATRGGRSNTRGCRRPDRRLQQRWPRRRRRRRRIIPPRRPRTARRRRR